MQILDVAKYIIHLYTQLSALLHLVNCKLFYIWHKVELCLGYSLLFEDDFIARDSVSG